MSDAVGAVNTITEELKTAPDRKATDGEIDEYFKGITILLQCFDLMSSLCYQPCASLADEDIANAKRIVVLFHKIWRCIFPSIPPKTHMWVHLLDNLDHTRGLKFHTESPVEVEHQFGKQDEKRFGNRNQTIKVLTMLQARANKKMPEVLEQQDEVDKGSKRKFTNPSGHQKTKKQKRNKITVAQLEQTAVGYTKIKSVEELEKLEYQQRKADSTEEEDLTALCEAIEVQLAAEAAAAMEE